MATYNYPQAQMPCFHAGPFFQSQIKSDFPFAISSTNSACRITIINTHPVAYGGQSNIYQGWLAGRLVAIKRPRVYAGKLSNTSVNDEARLMSLMRGHPHILNIIGITYHGGLTSIITPWMKQGTLLAYVQSGKCVGLKQKLILAKQIIGAIVFMKKLSIAHGDLKAANIFIRDNGTACLADFGLSRVVNPVRDTNHSVAEAEFSARGSLRWMAPELLLVDTCVVTHESDIYAYGMVMYETHTGRVPYSNVSDFTAFSQITNGQSPTRLGVPNEMWRLAQQCWNLDPNLRPTPERVIEMLDVMKHA